MVLVEKNPLFIFFGYLHFIKTEEPSVLKKKKRITMFKFLSTLWYVYLCVRKCVLEWARGISLFSLMDLEVCA